MKYRYPVACAMALLLLGAEPATGPSTLPHNKVGESIIILGDLGVPVGQQVTITGVTRFVRGSQTGFAVETINGKAAPAKLQIMVNGIAKWPNGTKATLSGYEVGTLVYESVMAENYGPNDPRWKGPHQELRLAFQIWGVISPEGLEVERAR